jgi:hypothetical protein
MTNEPTDIVDPEIDDLEAEMLGQEDGDDGYVKSALTVFKLVTGEEVIGTVVDEDEMTYILKNSLIIMINRNDSTTIFDRWIYHNRESLTQIYTYHIVAEYEPNDAMIEVYDAYIAELAKQNKDYEVPEHLPQLEPTGNEEVDNVIYAFNKTKPDKKTQN